MDPEKQEQGAGEERNRAAIGRFAPQSTTDQNADNPQLHFVATIDEEVNLNIAPFVGSLGYNGKVSIPRSALNSVLQETPDASPYMSLSQQFNLHPFRTTSLWKAALMEGMGSFMLVWISIFANASPKTLPEPPNPEFGPFANAAFIGPLVGGFLNFMFLTLFTICFGAVSGAHLNPTITIATLFARLCSFPRAVLYVSFQTGGAALAGMMSRASYGTRDFKVGGCWLATDIVPIGEAFSIEFTATTILLFFAFGVGLDPRQRQVVGPTLAPFLVGMALGSITFGTGFARYGYGGASLNPARCFGSYVGSEFPDWHWMHWIADLAACGVHAVFYFVVPPWQTHSN
jgi:glycerol uptake facilitator-like aquaporin